MRAAILGGRPAADGSVRCMAESAAALLLLLLHLPFLGGSSSGEAHSIVNVYSRADLRVPSPQACWLLGSTGVLPVLAQHTCPVQLS